MMEQRNETAPMSPTLRILELLGATALIVGLIVAIFGTVHVLHDNGIGARFSVGVGIAALGATIVGLSGSFTAFQTGSWDATDPVLQIVGGGFFVGGLMFAATARVDYLIGCWGISVVALYALSFFGFIGPRSGPAEPRDGASKHE